MTEDAIAQDLLAYVGRELLTDSTAELDASSPLLEWGILNSFSMVTLVTHLEHQYDVKVPPESMVPKHFKNVASIAALVRSLAPAA